MKKNFIIAITSVLIFSCAENISDNTESKVNNDLETNAVELSEILVFSTDPNAEINKNVNINEDFTSNTVCDDDNEHKEDGDVNCVTKINFNSNKYPDFEAPGSNPGIFLLDVNQDGQIELLHAYSPRGAWTSYTLYRLSNSSDNNEWKEILSYTEHISGMEEDAPKSYIYWLPKERKVKLVAPNDVIPDDPGEAFFEWDID